MKIHTQSYEHHHAQNATLESVQQLCKPLHRSVCVKIVRRHHLTLRWVLTLSPLGCDTNKPGGKRRCYTRSSLSAGVSFAGLVWPGLGSSWEETAGLSGTQPTEGNNNTKSRPLSDDQNTHTQTNVSPAPSFGNAPSCFCPLFGSEMTHPQVKSLQSTTTRAYFDSYFKRRSIFAQNYGRGNNSDLASTSSVC